MSAGQGSIHRFFDTVTGNILDFFFKNGVPTWKDTQGNEFQLDNPIFGRNVDLSVFDEYQMTTSGTNWDTYTGFQMPANKDGTYIIFAWSGTRMNTTTRGARMRVAKNGVTIKEHMNEEYKDTNSARMQPRTLIKKVDLVEGDFVDLDFATDVTDAIITVKEACILLWRIA